MSVQVSGGFRQLKPEILEQAIDRSLTTVGILLEGEVVSRANENVDTGRHKGSVTWQVKSGGSELHPSGNGTIHPEDKQSSPNAEHEVHVGTAVHYAPHLEYGHRTKGGGFVPAYPHFRKAFDENLGKVKEVFQKSFSAFIKRGQK